MAKEEKARQHARKQLRQAVENFDETVAPGDADFSGTGLAGASLVRLGFVSTVALTAVKGKIGVVAGSRHRRLLIRLAGYLNSLAT